MRIGLYGGSFDPVHIGHIAPILEARNKAELNRVIYLPTARPPHKEGRQLAPAEHRFAMVRLALAGISGLEVSDYEMGLDRPAYTVETLEHFARVFPEASLHLIIGADSCLHLDRWVRYRDILRAARLVVLVRPGWDLEQIHSPLAEELRAGEVVWVQNDAIDASSTEIRRRLSAGEELPQGWLPEPVLNYLTKHRLYAEPRAAR